MVRQSIRAPGAIKVLEKHTVYYSAAAEINELLHLFGIQRLLAFDTKSKAGKGGKRVAGKSEKGKQVQAKPAGLMGPKDPPQIVRSPNILGR